MTGELTPEKPSLVAEATKKASVAWVSAGGAPAVAVWCVPLDGSVFVVSGPGEQAAPGLAAADTATVTMRGDHGGRIVTWPAAVARVEPGTEEWGSVVPVVAAKRLNASGSIEDLVARWARECRMDRLTPSGEPTEAEATLPQESQAEQVRPTPAVRQTRRPFRLHRVRRPD